MKLFRYREDMLPVLCIVSLSLLDLHDLRIEEVSLDEVCMEYYRDHEAMA